MSFHQDSFHQRPYDPSLIAKYEKALIKATQGIKEIIRVQIEEEGLEGKREIIKNLKLLIDDTWEEVEEEG